MGKGAPARASMYNIGLGHDDSVATFTHAAVVWWKLPARDEVTLKCCSSSGARQPKG